MFLQDPASQVHPSAVPHFPAPMAATGSRIRCSARPSQQFQYDLQVNVKSNTVSSSAVREGSAMALLDSNTPLGNKIRQCRPANTFFTKGPMAPLEMREPMSFTPPLISLGLHTDAVLDRFKMDDTAYQASHTHRIHSQQPLGGSASIPKMGSNICKAEYEFEGECK